MSAKATIVLDRVLRVVRPLVRLLIRNGVPYQAFATALKRVFVDAARAELASRSMAQTDSAVTLLSGVHRRDVRNLGRSGGKAAASQAPPMTFSREVIAKWMTDPRFVDDTGTPRVLRRGPATDEGTFDALVAGMSQDVRPRAVLDELVGLGVVLFDEEGGEVRIVGSGSGFAPRADFEELAATFARTLHDHAAAAAANLQGTDNFLDQSLFVNEITEASAERLQKVSQQAWKKALGAVLKEANARFDEDAATRPASERKHRARFGVYFYSEREE
jgi:hypothetical protein